MMARVTVIPAVGVAGRGAGRMIAANLRFVREG